MPTIFLFVRRCGLFLAVFALASLRPAPAQEPPVPPVVVSPPASSPILPAEKPDLTLLQRALSPFANSPVADSVSDMDISASQQGVLFHLQEHMQVTAYRPARFASVVTLSPLPGGKPVRFLVASNGIKVTTFRPDVNKYAVVPLDQFEAGDDALPALGLAVGLLYLGNTSLVKNLDVIAKDTTGQSQAIMRKMGMALTSKTIMMDGVSYALFTLTLGKKGAYRFYVDPSTAQMAFVELRTVQEGVTIVMREKIVSFNPLLSAPAKTFLMAPPLEALRVPKLPVGY